LLGVELRMSDELIRFVAMGSTVEIATVDAPRGAEEHARTRVACLEASWSRFDVTSELSLLNRSGGRGPQRASTELMAAVDASLQLWRATDGWFDPSTLDVLEWSGYDRTFHDVRSRAVPLPPTCERPPVPGPDGVIVDHERGSITVPNGVRLDLGGVGKGLAADIVAKELVLLGALSACVSVGGDVAVAGSHPDGAWLVPVADPAHGGRTGWEVPLRSGAIVQSSRSARSWLATGVQRNHLIDPRTGACADSGVSAAVVIADRAWWAEGVAKAAVLAGVAEGAALIRRLATAGWLIRDDGCVVMVGEVDRRCAA
jgi:thiamine biosynthesis lipoprotein